jgi:hypothetical protein
MYISFWNSFISLSYKSSFYSDLAILPQVAYYKNLSLKSENNLFGYIWSSLYADYVLVYS